MQRLQDLWNFASKWLGRELTAADGCEVPAGLGLPQALREVYETFGSVSQLTQPHNQLLAPGDIESIEGYHIFYDENQWVVRWAFRDADRAVEDPVVFQGTTQENGYEWFSEEMTVSEWIRVITLWQLVNGGYPRGAYSGGIPDATAVVEAHYPRVGGHQDGSTRFYGVPGRLVCLAGSASIPSVWAAGATPEDLEALSSRLDFEWDHSSADD